MNFLLTPKLGLRAVCTLLVLLGCITMVSTNLSAQCSLACGANTNVSLDENCEALISPETILLDDTSCPAGTFTVEITDSYGNSVPNPVTGDYLDQTLTVSVVDGTSDNSCWGFITLEDYLAPVAECPTEPIPMPCAMVETFVPIFVDACDGDIEGSLLFEFPKEEICEGTPVYDDLAAIGLDPELYSHSVTRIFGAEDLNGNEAEQCTIQILVERLDETTIVPPPSYIYDSTTNTALSCDGTWGGVDNSGNFGIADDGNDTWDDNGDGYPDPLEVGVPTIDGESIWPFPLESFCKIGVYFTDQEYPSGDDCKRHILRTWEVREWYCGTEVEFGPYFQTIVIKDFEAPVVTCDFGSNPDECIDYLTITTNTHSYGANGSSCGATYLPGVPTITDNCSTEFVIDIQFTQMETGNAGFISDWDGTTEIELDMGLSQITYFVKDACHNVGTCTYFIDVEDDTPPAMICDQNTVVSLTTTGTAKVYASTFDEGSHDDCQLKKLLVRRMDTTCDCDPPVYPDAILLGEFNGHYYYHSSYAVNWYKARDLSIAMGASLVVFANAAEEDWVDEAVLSAGGNLYHSADVDDCADRMALLPYVFELDDPCTFGSSVKFCCDDVDSDEIMVVLRAVDAYGNFNECMVNVDVQDKIGPNIVCEPDLEVPCNTPFDEVNGFTHLTGSGASATNHCGDVLIPVPTYEVVNGPCDNIDFVEITWTVTDGDGNSTSCVQIVNFEDPEDFDESNIIWPDADITIPMCDNPDELGTDVTGLPTYTGITSCNVLAYNYTDVIFYLNNVEPNACFKVKRTWTVIDWCSLSEFTFVQTIKATNDVAPVIDGDCAPVVLCTVEGECEANVILSQSATDTDCTLAENLVWTAYIDIDNDGSFDGDAITTTGPSLEVSGTFPIGTHKIKWQVDDRCGNTDVCTQEFTVIPCNAPAIYCTSPALVLPLGESGEVEIWVTDWDCTSDLPCDGDPILSFDETTIVTNVTYSCADIPAGETSAVIEQTIYAIAYDMDGNIVSNQVIVTAEVQDNLGFCDDGTDPGTGGTGNEDEEDQNDEGSTRHSIAGSVQLEDGRVLTDVSIDLEGGNLTETTDDSGAYAFPEMENGSSYILNPDKQDPHVMGVSTLDIIMLQRHILNVETLNSPYKYIAADANADEKLTASDIVDIRKLILEYHSEYPSNDAWRFVDRDYSFIDSNNPLFESFTEEYQIINLDNDMEVNFIAMKVGDINSSIVISELNGSDTESRSGEYFPMTLGEPIPAGDVTEIPVYTDKAVYGAQFAIDYVGDLSLLGLKAGAMTLTDDHYHLIDNSVAMSYSTEHIVEYTLDEPAFYIVVDANATLEISNFRIDTESINAQAYSSNLEVLTPTFITESQEAGFALYQNTPNPFNTTTQISFNLPSKMDATLLVRDVTGKVIFTQSTEYTQGINTVNIDRDQLTTGGIYYYSIEAGNFTATKKMVVLN